MLRQTLLLWPYFVGATVVLVLFVYVGISLWVANSVTRVERLPLDPPPTAIAPTHEDVAFRSADGLLLKGWWFPVDGADRAIVMVHGRARNRVNSSFHPAKIARMLLRHGYSVLLFDLRAHGESEGTRYTLGVEEPRDILAAIDFAAAKARLPRARVALIGESLGGGSALMTVHAVPSIGPVITDSAFADANTVVSESATMYTNLPAFFTPSIVLTARVFLGLDVSNVTPANVVAAHPERPFLFIHCVNDDTVLVHHSQDLRAASANAGTELWLVPDCGHVQAYITRPAEWEQRVIAFLDRELGPERPTSSSAAILARP